MSSNQIPKRSLGNEGLKVSAIGLGTMTMPDNQDSINTIRGALDYGVTLFDTADLYGTGLDKRLIFFRKSLEIMKNS
ncbi:MAG: aldo/keto reductase [Sphingobacterium hotanense]